MTVQQQESFIGSWEWDFNTNIVKIAKELYPVYDINADIFAGNFEAIINVIHPEDIDMFTGSLTGNMCSDKVIFLEYRIVHKNGDVRKIYSEANVKFDETSKPLKYIFKVKDITDVAQSEEQKHNIKQITQLSGYYDKIKENERYSILQDLYHEFGLLAAMAWIICDFEHKCNIKVTHNLGEEIPMPYDISIIILKILKSSLSNIAKHSKATKAAVKLNVTNGTVNFKVSDNGVGIAENTIASKGFLKMSENVTKLGGKFTITNEDSNGLVLVIEIPLNN